MAHLWVRDEAEQLIEVPIESATTALVAAPPYARPGRPDLAPEGGGVGAWIQSARSATGLGWVLITRASERVLVNGVAVPAGIRVLDTRDEIRCADGSVFVFADERYARVEAFPASSAPVRCGRCTVELEPALPAVRCPACGTWYHEHGDFPCWTSVPFCQACGHATTLTGEDRWRPEER